MTGITKITTPDLDDAKRVFALLSQPVQEIYWMWRDTHVKDFSDYAALLQSAVEQAGAIFIKANRHPFGCIFETPKAQYIVTVNSKTCSLDPYGPARRSTKRNQKNG